MKVVHTEIEIRSSAPKVWDVLTRFEDYPEWNPFIPRIVGGIRQGEKLTIDVRFANGWKWTFRPVVLKAEVNREFRWKGRLIMPRIFDGEHTFTINSVGENTTRLVQQEEFSGILVPLLWKNWSRNTREGFVQMNEALKKRVELANNE